MKHISITGDLGSGKSTVARLICETTAYEYFSTGALQRKLAAEKGMDTLQMNYFSETTNAVDDYIDAYLKNIEKDRNPKVRYVLDSRLAWHFVPSSFKVFLTVDTQAAARRVLADTARSSEAAASSVEKEAENLLERQAVEARRFKKLYDVTYRDLANYDLVIDTTHISPEETAARILEAAAADEAGLSPADVSQIRAHGQSVNQVLAQLKSFETGFPYLKLAGSACAGQGITVLSAEEEAGCLEAWDRYLETPDHRVVKFVPASGAASRMFKDLFAYLGAGYDAPQTDFEQKFCAHCGCFAFSRELDETCRANEGKTLEELAADGAYKVIVENLLTAKGMNYGALPKGLLTFHAYDTGARKAVTEHLVEGALYARDADGNVRLHFTVSPEHRALFEAEIARVKEEIEEAFDARFHVSFSEQKPSTDTIAADAQNRPFRDGGQLLFRPGGHGALIENLNETEGDVIFVKNIDNVVPDRLKPTTVRYKKLLAGLLVSLQAQAFEALRKLESGRYSHADLLEINAFLEKSFSVQNPAFATMEDSEKAVYLRRKLNRPMRVCGMVRNQGEPGGGPFRVYDEDGCVSLQILESSQIDKNDEASMAMFREGTHFNPVDLVCAVRDIRGRRFHLPDFTDPKTGFISSKSKNGQELKALELPGLWNGAMSNWNTAFVEVPIETFNPVKTVNDLLREQHR